MKDRIRNNDLSFEMTPLTAPMEDYIETIANLSSEKKVVRVKDIAKKLRSMATWSSLLKAKRSLRRYAINIAALLIFFLIYCG
jgi:hypothetical protein